MKDVVRFTPLGDLVTIVMGQAPSSKDCNFDGRGTPFVKAGEFGARRPIIREWTTNPLKHARKTDVLLCVVGATCGKLNLGEDCAIGRSVAAIRPEPTKLDQFYLHYFLMTLVDRLRAGSVGAAQTVISKEMIQSVTFPWREVPEQRRIVDDSDAVVVEGALIGRPGQVAIDAEMLVLRRRHVVERVGFPAEIDIGELEVVERAEILLRPQADLEDRGPAHHKQDRLPEKAKRSSVARGLAVHSELSNHIRRDFAEAADAHQRELPALEERLRNRKP